MKKFVSLLTPVVAFAMSLSTFNMVAFAEQYVDVPETHWAYKAVERCSATNWFSGYPDGSFRPDGKITRSEAIKVFVQFLGEPLPTNLTSSSFFDVAPTDWFAPYVEAGKDLFPMRSSMNSQPKFQPDMPVTREDTVYALVNALNYDTKVTNADQSVLNMFKDQNSISAMCRAHLAVAVSNELLSGYSDGTIGAQDPLTRAQFATLLYRATYVGALNETNRVLTKISIEPSVVSELKIGDTVEFSAIAEYSDGTKEDYSLQLNPYTDGDGGILAFNRNKITAVGAGTVVVKFNSEQLKDKQVVIVVSKPEPVQTEDHTTAVDDTTVVDEAEAEETEEVAEQPIDNQFDAADDVLDAE